MDARIDHEFADEFIRQELTAFAAAARSLKDMMMRRERMPASGRKTVNGGFGISNDLAGQRPQDDQGSKFKSTAGEAIVAALRAHISNMPAPLRIGFGLDAEGNVFRSWLDHSCTDPEIDLIAIQVLRGLRFSAPRDLPMPLMLSVIIVPGAWIYTLDEEAP